MRRRRVAVPAIAAVGLLATSITAPPAALAQDRYSVTISEKTPNVRYFRDFTYDVAEVTGPKRWVSTRITRAIRAFSMPEVTYWLKPSADTTAYLKRAKPANFDSRLTPTPDCRSDYVCVSHFASFATPILAGSVTYINAQAWSTRTTKKARLKDFVSEGQLRQFTKAVKNKIRRAPCYYGFPIDLPAEYSSFPYWVPKEGGIEVWFPEYQFGCQIMELTVPWR